MRDIYFFRKEQETVFNVTGSGTSTNSFDLAIAEINANIDYLTDLLNGKPGQPSLVAKRDKYKNDALYYQAKRDQQPKNKNNPQRISFNALYVENWNLYRAMLNLIAQTTKALNEAKTIDLPAALAAKEAAAKIQYNQTFANQGVDVVGQQEIARYQAEAQRIAAESTANIKKMQTETANKIAETTSKTTRNIIIIVVIVVLVTTAFIIYKRRKNA
jgi:hypothetical protein